MQLGSFLYNPCFKNTRLALDLGGQINTETINLLFCKCNYEPENIANNKFKYIYKILY